MRKGRARDVIKESSDLARRLGAAIKDGRDRKKLSQTDLAKALGVSRQAVSMWEAGVNVPNVRRWDELRKLLDIAAGQQRIPMMDLSAAPSEALHIPTYFTKPTAEEDQFLIDTEGVRFTASPPGAHYIRGIIQCLIMPNSTMVPWRYPLDAVYFTDGPSRAGDFILVQFGGKPLDVFKVLSGPVDEDGYVDTNPKHLTGFFDPTAPYAVKQLVAFDHEFVRLGQLSPKREVTIDRGALGAVFRVLDRDVLYEPYLEVPG